MTIPQPPDPYSAAASTASTGAASSIIPGSALGASQMTINTSTLNVTSANTAASGGLFGYEGVPQTGSLLFSMTPASGTDAYGNTYPSGVVVNAGQINGVTLTGVGLDSTSTLQGSLINSALVATPLISGGTATSTLHVLNTAGGAVLSYSNNSGTATFSTAGSYLWTCPTNVTQAQVQCWGAGAGGGGGSPNQGGEGGGGGEYAAEPTLNVTPGSVYQVTVGAGGAGGSTNTSGSSGSDTIFSDNLGNNLVYAYGGQAGLNFQGGAGGVGSSNTIEEPGGSGASASGNSGASGGGSSGGTSVQGNNGTASTGATGGAGGAAPAGGGAGGAGGNNNANGTSGSSPGGAGGGAGEAAGAGASSATYYCTGSYSYYGQTATYGSGPYSRRSVNSSIYQGCASGYAFLTGDQYGFALFNYRQMQSDLSGATINNTYLSLNNLHSWYNNGMYAVIGYTTFTGTFGTTFQPGAGTHEAEQVSWISEGATVTYKLSSWLNSHIATDFTAIILGPAASSGVSGTNLSYYGYFYGYNSNDNNSVPRIGVTYTPSGSGSENAGNGADGQVSITYNTANTLVGAFTPVGGTDVYGNTYAPGSTTVQHTFIATASSPSTPASGNVALSTGTSGQLQVTTDTGVTSSVATGKTGSGGNTVTGTSTVQLSDGFVINSGDVNTGTAFRLTTWGNGNTGSGTLSALTLNIQGGQAQITWPTSAQSLNVQTIWRVVCDVVFTSSTSANIHAVFEVSNAGGTVNAVEAGDSTAYSPSFPYTLAVFAHWGATETAQTITCHGSIFERIANLWLFSARATSAPPPSHPVLSRSARICEMTSRISSSWRITCLLRRMQTWRHWDSPQATFPCYARQ